MDLGMKGCEEHLEGLPVALHESPEQLAIGLVRHRPLSALLT